MNFRRRHLAAGIMLLAVLFCIDEQKAKAQTLAPAPCQQFFSASGIPLAGGFLYSYTAGTSTLTPTYADSAASIANSNPIILNAGGFPVSATGGCGIWLAAGTGYKFVVQNSTHTAQWTVDNIFGNLTSALLSTANTWTAAQTFSAGITGTGNIGTLGLGSTALGATNTWSGANTFSSTATFGGNVTETAGQNIATFYNVNKVIHVNTTGPYTTIANALSSGCPSAPNGCHIIVDDGTALTSVPSFSLGATPCQNYFAQILELGANTSITMNGTITLNCGGYIYGDNRDGNIIITSGTFPSNTAMVTMGDTAATYHSIDARVEGVNLNCNNVTGCTGITAQGLNENSTIGRLSISNYLGNCISVNGTNAPSTSNYIIFDIDCQNSGTTNDSILLTNAGTNLLQRITVVSNTATQSSGAAIHITGTGAGNFNGHNIITLHCEKHNDCILMDGNQGASATYVDGENGVVNTVRMAATANGVFTGNFIRNNANSVSNPIIKNQVTGTSITSNNPSGGIVPFYTWAISQSEWWIDNLGVHGPNLISNGTQSVSGCSLTASAGGQTSGKFASGTSGTCTVTITLPAAPTGWTCDAHDTTTPADVINQTAFATNSATISGTTVSADIVTWKCSGF